MMKNKCKVCEKNFKVLTKEGLCVYCFKNEKKFWPKEFLGPLDKDGKPFSGPMKFRKTKVRNRKKKKKK